MNLKKILAGVAAAALTATSLVLPASAAASSDSQDITLGDANFIFNGEDGIPYSDWSGYTTLTVKFEANADAPGKLAAGSWWGCNGAVGYNDKDTGEWTSKDWSFDNNSGNELKDWSVTIDLVKDVYRPADLTAENSIKIACWWSGGDAACGTPVLGTYSYEFSGTYEASEPEDVPIESEPEAAEPDNTVTAAEPVLLDLTAAPVMKLDGGLRLNFSHPWGEPEDNIINWEDVEGTQVISVKFQVTGLTAKEVYQAYLDISNFDGGINYWGPTDASNAYVTQTPVTIAGDGVYVATVELDIPYTVTDLNFLALQTDMDFDPYVDENCPQIGFIAAAIDAPLVVEDGEVPVYPASTRYNGSLTMSDETWWSEYEVSLEELIGNLDPAEVKSIIFFAEGHDFIIGYNSAEGWEQPSVPFDEPLLVNNVLCTTIPDDSAPEGERGYYLKACLSAGDGVDYTLSWIASTEELNLSDFVEEDTDSYTFAYESSVTLTATDWWTAYEPTLQELIGDLDPAAVTAIVFTSDDDRFFVGYNTTEAIYDTYENPYFCQNASAVKKLVAENISFAFIEDDPWASYYFTIAVSEDDGVARTIKWGVVVDESIATSTPDVVSGDDTNTTAPENTNGGATSTDTNPPTGVIFAIIPAVAAAAGVVIAKKRK